MQWFLILSNSGDSFLPSLGTVNSGWIGHQWRVLSGGRENGAVCREEGAGVPPYYCKICPGPRFEGVQQGIPAAVPQARLHDRVRNERRVCHQQDHSRQRHQRNGTIVEKANIVIKRVSDFLF